MRVFDPIPPRFTKVGKLVAKCAENVYDRLGPGLIENAYLGCLAVELELSHIAYEKNVDLPLIYEGTRIESAMRLDLVVEEAVLVTVLSVDSIQTIHEMRMQTLLKFSELRLGLVINFDVPAFKQAIRKVTA